MRSLRRYGQAVQMLLLGSRRGMGGIIMEIEIIGILKYIFKLRLGASIGYLVCLLVGRSSEQNSR